MMDIDLRVHNIKCCKLMLIISGRVKAWVHEDAQGELVIERFTIYQCLSSAN